MRGCSLTCVHCGIDAVLAVPPHHTGGTMKAAVELVRSVGGEVVACLTIVEIEDLKVLVIELCVALRLLLHGHERGQTISS